MRKYILKILIFIAVLVLITILTNLLQVGYTFSSQKQFVKDIQATSNSSNSVVANSKGKLNKNSKVYILPLLNSSKIGEISSDVEVLVVSIAGKWAYVQNNDITGWVFKDNINCLEENTTNEPTEKTNDNKEENIVENVAKEENTNQEQENKVKEDTNNVQTSKSYPKTMYVNVEAVYIRAKPSTESSAITSVGKNTPVTVNGEDGDWYKVHVSDGSGYMMKKYLSLQKQ